MARERKNTAAAAEEIAQPVLEKMGLRLWDVRFEKEGSGWYLRYFIDKAGGVTIDDCEAFSRAVDPLLDEADPIDQSYCLEVSSPGVERELIRPWHFDENLGKTVQVRLIRPRDGVREFSGTLLSYENNTASIAAETGETVSVPRTEAAYIRLTDDFDYGKGAKE